MERIAFYILLSASVVSSIAFEMHGTYSVFGLSVYFFLTILIALSKLYISFFNKNIIIITLLSLATTIFASLDVINHYIESKMETSLKREYLVSYEDNLATNRSQQKTLIKREESLNKTLSYGYSPKPIIKTLEDNKNLLESLKEEEKILQEEIHKLKEKTNFNPFVSLITLIFIFSNELILAYLLSHNGRKALSRTTKLTELMEKLKEEVPQKESLIIIPNNLTDETLKALIDNKYIVQSTKGLYSTKYASIVELSKGK